MGKRAYIKGVANPTVIPLRQDSSLLMVKTIAILKDIFFSSQGKMSEEDDYSQERSNQES